MLGTYSPVTPLDWAVVCKSRSSKLTAGHRDAAHRPSLALLAVLLSIGVSIFAARRITNPLQI